MSIGDQQADPEADASEQILKEDEPGYNEQESGQLGFRYEQDPDKQTEADISAATDARAMASAWHRRTEGTVLANRISADFQDRGATTLIGQEIADHKDLADLAEIYRNPQL